MKLQFLQSKGMCPPTAPSIGVDSMWRALQTITAGSRSEARCSSLILFILIRISSIAAVLQFYKFTNYIFILCI